MGEPMDDIYGRARFEGVEDAYGFAEWLVDEQEHFGDPAALPDHELELAFEQAMRWWENRRL